MIKHITKTAFKFVSVGLLSCSSKENSTGRAHSWVGSAILEYWVYERIDTEIYCGHLQFMCKCHTHSRRLIKEAAEVKGWPLKCTVLSKNTNSWSYFKKIVIWMYFFSVIYLIIVFRKVLINLGQIIVTFTWCAGFFTSMFCLVENLFWETFYLLTSLLCKWEVAATTTQCCLN